VYSLTGPPYRNLALRSATAFHTWAMAAYIGSSSIQGVLGQNLAPPACDNFISQAALLSALWHRATGQGPREAELVWPG